MTADRTDQLSELSSSRPQERRLQPLDVPYLLALNIPHYVDDDGAVFLDSAWHHDLKEHVAYLPQLRVLSPRVPLSEANVPDLERVEVPCEFVAIPPQRSMREALKTFPETLWTTLRAVNGSVVVHSGVAGWPYPVGWLATLAAKLRGKVLFIVIESAPWRLLEQDRNPSKVARLRAAVYERVAVWTCRTADLIVYTQPAYQQSFQPGSRGAGHVVPATWITDRYVLSTKEAENLWRKKAKGPVRFLFAGRIEAVKGVHVLLGALRKLDAEGVPIHMTFFGAGSAEAAIAEAASGFSLVQIERHAPVPYGTEFFSVVDEHHVLVAPSLADEQPRILFDVAARGVSVIASGTDGIRPHLRDGETGLMVPPGDEAALAEAIRSAAQDMDGLRARGLKALEYARPFTHAAMHTTRQELFARYFAPLYKG